MKDNNGVEIQIGDLVAYNRSGDVEAGFVRKFGKHWRRGYQSGVGIVARGYTHTFVENQRDRKLSKVMRPTSLMVIESLPLEAKASARRYSNAMYANSGSESFIDKNGRRIW